MSDLRCSITGRPIEPGDGVWDDGEWISWEWINSQLPDDSDEESEASFPRSEPSGSYLELAEVFQDLVDCACRHLEVTGRHLEIWGELGEIYAQLHFGLVRHPKHHAGSDGTIDGKRVEVKTISPEKKSDKVFVKRAGDFEKLLIIRISDDYWFTGKLFDRSELREGYGKHYRKRFDDDSRG